MINTQLKMSQLCKKSGFNYSVVKIRFSKKLTKMQITRMKNLIKFNKSLLNGVSCRQIWYFSVKRALI